MKYIYCAFSRNLNIHSHIEDGQLYLLKFGSTSKNEVPIRRFNEGWNYDHKETEQWMPGDKHSPPLGTYNDWEEVGIWKVGDNISVADKEIHRFIDKFSTRFKLYENLKEKIRRNDPRENLNGLSEIRHFAIDGVCGSKNRYSSNFHSDSYSDKAICHLFGYVAGFVKAHLYFFE